MEASLKDGVKIGATYSAWFLAKTIFVRVSREVLTDWWSCTNLETGRPITLPTSSLIRQEPATGAHSELE
jgi:hypothetical protein